MNYRQYKKRYKKLYGISPRKNKATTLDELLKELIKLGEALLKKYINKFE